MESRSSDATGRGVAQVISSGGLYGAERVVLELASFLASQGWESHVLLLASPGAQEVVAEARRLGLRTEILAGSAFAIAGALRRYASTHAIRVIHSHGYRPDIFLAMAQFGASTVRIATCHTWYRESWKLKLYELLDKTALRVFDRVVAVSPELEREVLSSGLRKQAVRFIQNGMDFSAAAPERREAVRQSLGLAADERFILRVGRLSTAKGNDVLLEALAGVPAGVRWRLMLAGDGEEAAHLLRITQQRELVDRVIFAGFRRDISDLLAAADLFVIPSLKEGLPMVLLEAMASGCAIVTTTVGAIPGVITDGQSGLLVPPGDPVSLLRAMTRLLEDGELAHSLSAGAQRCYLAGYSRKAMGEQYVDLYNSALATKP